jgi:hypothetical protein
MAGSVAQFKQFYPEFDALSDAQIEFALECVRERVSVEIFGKCYLQALYSLLAHVIAIRQRGDGATGSVTSEKVGDLQRSYGASSSNSLLATTSYGLNYLALVRMYAGGGVNVC